MAALLLLPPCSSAVDCVRSSNLRRNIKRSSWILIASKRKRRMQVAASGNGSRRKQAVEDMEQYLEDLSLEYDSVWDTKPAWCQPWSIVVTGMLVIVATWPLFQSVPLTSFVALLIGAWWFVFLYSYPQAYSQMIAERRKKVEEGIEDTFGMTQERQVK